MFCEKCGAEIGEMDKFCRAVEQRYPSIEMSAENAVPKSVKVTGFAAAAEKR